MKINDYRKKLNSSFQEENVPNVLENIKKTSVFENREVFIETKEEKRVSFGFIARFAFAFVICLLVVIVGINGPLKNGVKEENNGASNGVSDDEGDVVQSPDAPGDVGLEGGELPNEGVAGESKEDDESNFASSDIDKVIMEDIKVYIYSNSATLEETIIYANSQKYMISEKVLEEIYNSVIKDSGNSNGEPNE